MTNFAERLSIKRQWSRYICITQCPYIFICPCPFIVLNIKYTYTYTYTYIIIIPIYVGKKKSEFSECVQMVAYAWQIFRFFFSSSTLLGCCCSHIIHNNHNNKIILLLPLLFYRHELTKGMVEEIIDSLRKKKIIATKRELQTDGSDSRLKPSSIPHHQISQEKKSKEKKTV